MMNKAINTRLSPEEAKEMINRIPALRDFFNHWTEDGLDVKVGKILQEGDATDTILYLSRQVTTKKPKHEEDEDSKREAEAKKVEEKKVKNIIEDYKSLGGSSNKDNSNIDKKRRFALALATISSKKHKRYEIVMDGGIPALIELSIMKDNFIQRCCAAAFAYFSIESSIRGKMIDGGAYPAIASLSASSTSAIVKVACIRAICNLCCESGFEAKLVRDGCAAVVPNMISACPEVVDVGLKILLNLSCVPDKYSRIEDLVETLMHFSGVFLSEEGEHLVISILCNLSALRNNQLKLVEDGCMKLVDRILKSKNPKLRILASEVIKNLSTDSRTRYKLVENNIIHTLLIMSKDENSQVQLLCVKTFYNLSRDNVCREKIIHANALPVIIRMCMDTVSNIALARGAAKIIRLMCSDSELAQKLVNDGIVKALMALRAADDHTIQQFCAESLCSLFQIDSVLHILVEQGAVGVLVYISENSTDAITSEWCSFALYHLATSGICPTSMLEGGILPCVTKLCIDESTVGTRYFCASTLAFITQSKIVDASYAIPLLVEMLQTDPDQKTMAACATALYNMADDDENCFAMLEHGGLVSIVRLITVSESMQTKMKCAAILSRLSLHETYYHEFAGDNILRVLLELSTLDHILTQRRVVIALSNLSQSEELRIQLLALNPIPFIISLASKRDENLRRGCSAIVCNLAYEVGREKSIANAGIIPTLLITAMITSDQPDTKMICVKAMINLMADESLHKLLVDEGVVWGLSTLGLIDDFELLKLCSSALCLLSSKYARVMLNSPNSVKMILKLINQSDLDLLRNGAKALTNLLFQTTDSDEKFRCLVVENLSRMAQHEDEEVSKISVLCLCFSSQSEACRESIVSKGLLSGIDSNTIFGDQKVCYAYLTMFGNIANNPSMRTKILDERALKRFEKICTAHDPQLDLAVLKAIYCLSCADSNISKLANQNVIFILEGLWNRDYEKSNDIILHLIAILYNLTVISEIHSKLVSQGIVELLVQIWPVARENLQMCTLVCSATCHLASGNVNTSRMVSSGCTKILCFMTAYKSLDQYKSYYFDINLYLRCSVAIRNLMCVVANQKTMVNEGCIAAIIAMADVLHLTSNKKAPPRKSSSFNSKGNFGSEYFTPDQLGIRDNCSASLRAMSFNTELRKTLLESDGINIILERIQEEMQGEDEALLQHKLLLELEAESWENPKCRHKEGRTEAYPTLPLFADLLSGTISVELKADIKFASLEKYHVQVVLDEPKIEQESSKSSIELSINDLTRSNEESEDQQLPQAMMCGKESVDIEFEFISSLYNRDPTIEDDDNMSANQSINNSPENDNNNKLPVISNSFTSVGDIHKGETKMSLSSSVNTLKLPKAHKSKKDLNPDEKFQNLVGMINAAKKASSKGSKNTMFAPSVHDLVDEWRSMSNRK